MSNEDQQPLFFGYSSQIDSIIETLCDLDIPEHTERTIFIEGPSRSGKTKLLQQIADRLIRLERPVVRTCLIDSSDMSSHNTGFGEIGFRLAGRLWMTMKSDLPDVQDPALLFNPMSDAADADKERLLAEWVGSFAAGLVEAKGLFVLVLVVDGLDEFESKRLNDLEEQLIIPLYRNSRVRLLYSRRADIVDRFWQDLLIKNYVPELPDNKYRFLLEHFDGKDKQLDALAAHYHLNVDDIRVQLSESFGWTNPGVNAFLLAHAARNGGIILADDIRCCIKYMLLFGKDIRVLPVNLQHIKEEVLDTFITNQLFENLNAVFRHSYERIASGNGVPRNIALRALNAKKPSDREAFLDELQDRGVGQRESIYFRAHPIYVELFHELWDKSAT